MYTSHCCDIQIDPTWNLVLSRRTDSPSNNFDFWIEGRKVIISPGLVWYDTASPAIHGHMTMTNQLSCKWRDLPPRRYMTLSRRISSINQNISLLPFWELLSQVIFKLLFFDTINIFAFAFTQLNTKWCRWFWESGHERLAYSCDSYRILP